MSTKIETVTMGSNRKIRVPLVILFLTVILLLFATAGFIYLGSNTETKPLTQTLSEPLSSATTAKVEIDPGDGNLVIDGNTGGEPVLASGTLQYLQNQGLPTHLLDASSNQVTLVWKASSGGQPWLRFPWDACNGATEWQVHLNPQVASDITAHSNGGNITLNLAGMVVSRVSADTGGGNMTVILPDNTANLNTTVKTGAGDVTVQIGSGITGSNTVNASSGAGNVTVSVPANTAARIHTTGGLGKDIVDARFSKIDDHTYQSPNYENAANKVEITVNSGAGNLIIHTN